MWPLSPAESSRSLHDPEIKIAILLTIATSPALRWADHYPQAPFTGFPHALTFVRKISQPVKRSIRVTCVTVSPVSHVGRSVCLTVTVVSWRLWAVLDRRTESREAGMVGENRYISHGSLPEGSVHPD